MKNKKIIMIFIVIFVVASAIYAFIKHNSLKEINKNYLKVSQFIDCVDDVSENKAQINWKQVCAIVSVIEHNKLEDINDLDIIEVAQLFIDDKNEFVSFDDVLEELEFSNKQKERAYKYVEDLRYYGLTPGKTQKDTKQTIFIESIKEGAIENYRKYKILPSITIAQAILESSWGESKLASEYNNLFGIKADSSWLGEEVTLETTEYDGMVISDKFRKYDDKNQSVNDHGKFLYENKRYKNNGVFEANTYKYQAKALENAGYSTHMNENGEKLYAKQLIQLIKQYNLHLIDNEVL